MKRLFDMSDYIMVVPYIKVSYNRICFTVKEETIEDSNDGKLTMERTRRYIHDDVNHEKVGRKWYNKLAHYIKAHTVSIGSGTKFVKQSEVSNFCEGFQELAEQAQAEYNRGNFHIFADVYPIQTMNDALIPVLLELRSNIVDLSMEFKELIEVDHSDKKKLDAQKAKVRRLLKEMRKKEFLVNSNSSSMQVLLDKSQEAFEKIYKEKATANDIELRTFVYVAEKFTNKIDGIAGQKRTRPGNYKVKI